MLQRDKGRAYLHMLQKVYDAFYYALLLLSWPYLLYKMVTSPKHRAGMRQRLGGLPFWPTGRPRIWIHGVSVGEVLAAKSLVNVLEEELPGHEIVISTTTKSGQAVAKSHYAGKHVFYYPLDFSWSTREVLRRLRPEAVILMELEIWPNFLLSTSTTQVPVLLVNGRISERSFRHYRVLQKVIPEPMDRIRLYCVQTRTYAERFLRLGVQPDRVKVTGTMKFDNILTEGAETRRRELLEGLGLEAGDRVLLAGSTHPTEEAVLYEIFEALRREAPEFRFVVVPRHPERFAEVEALLVHRGAEVVRKTSLGAGIREKGRPVILGDTMGELADLYAVADLVFVGGSLVPHGGQNMMEPAGLGRAVIFGPHVFNFQESVDILLDEDAAIMARDAAHLKEVILSLAREPRRATEMGDRARRVVREHKGASSRILKLIRPFFSNGSGKGTE